MYFLWGLKHLQLEFLLKCPGSLVDESLVAESIAEIDSSIEFPQGVIGLNYGGQALHTQGAVEDVQLAEFEETNKLDTVIRHVPRVLHIQTLEANNSNIQI